MLLACRATFQIRLSAYARPDTAKRRYERSQPLRVKLAQADVEGKPATCDLPLFLTVSAASLGSLCRQAKSPFGQ